MTQISNRANKSDANRDPGRSTEWAETIGVDDDQSSLILKRMGFPKRVQKLYPDHKQAALLGTIARCGSTANEFGLGFACYSNLRIQTSHDLQYGHASSKNE